MAAVKFTLNGKPQTVDVAPAMPLLWVLRDTLGMTGTKFGCGMALCGACTVHIDGQPTRSCVTPISSVAGKSVTTIEGLSPDSSHPVQLAWIEEDVPQCGYCQSGQIMTAAALLAKTSQPTDADIDEAMRGNICRCGTYDDIRRGHPSRGRDEARGRCPMSAPHESPQLSPQQRRCRRRTAGRLLPPGTLATRGRSPPAPLKLNALVHVGTDDAVTLFIHKAEMGQGTVTSLSMLLAEELECDWKKIRTEFPGVDREYGRIQGVVGSASIRSSWESLRRAGAAAREMLISAAAQQWGVDRSACRAENSTVVNTATNARLSLWQPGGGRGQAAGPRSNVALRTRAVPPDRQAHEAARHARQGERQRALWHRRAAAGDAVRGGRALPGVRRQGRELRRRQGQGRPRREERGADLQRRGRGGGQHLVGDGRPARARRQVGRGPGGGREHARHHARSSPSASQQPGAVARKEGDAAAALAGAAKKIDAVYEVPYLAHAPMEPLNCTADVRADALRGLGVDAEAERGARRSPRGSPACRRRRCRSTRSTWAAASAGAAASDYIAEAVEVSKAVGVPVKVTWSREDDMRQDHVPPGVLLPASPAGWMPTGGRWRGPARIACPPFGGLRNGLARTGVRACRRSRTRCRNSGRLPRRRPGNSGELLALGGLFAEHVLRRVVRGRMAAAGGKDPVEVRRRLLAKSRACSRRSNWRPKRPVGASRWRPAGAAACRCRTTSAATPCRSRRSRWKRQGEGAPRGVRGGLRARGESLRAWSSRSRAESYLDCRRR